MHNDERSTRLLCGWGRTPWTASDVRSPRSDDDVGEALARPAARGVIARGLGRSYGDAAQNAGGLVLDMISLSTVRAIDLEKGTVTAGGGVSLDRLMHALIPLGWFVAVSPGTSHVTVGGAIAADIHGKNHHRDGSFGDHVTAIELATPIGRRRLVPKDDPEAFAATCGGMGLTGIVLEATLRLLPVATSLMRVDTDRAENLDEAMDLMERGDSNYRYSVAWIDCLARGGHLGRSVLTRADHANIEELLPKHHRDVLAFSARTQLRAPKWLPHGLVNRLGVRAFNEFWFRRSPRRERGALRSIASYFHPLDAVDGWNRMYGPRGFLQYQFVVPFGEEDVLRRILERLSTSGYPSFLAVLKRFGAGRGLLSFPAPGWTLALDIPSRLPGLGPFLDSMDELVAAAGGRIYLAKDSRMRPEMVPIMYPELDRWREIRSTLDPERIMRSDLDRRLNLTGD